MFPSECAIMYLRPGSAFTAEARPDADAKAFSTFPWHDLFDSGDARRSLTWRGRFASVENTVGGQPGQPVVALPLVAPPRDDREGRLHPRPPEALEHGTPPQARLALVHVVAVYEDDVCAVGLGVRAHLGAVHRVLPRCKVLTTCLNMRQA